jgi:hypothetical protein
MYIKYKERDASPEEDVSSFVNEMYLKYKERDASAQPDTDIYNAK